MASNQETQKNSLAPGYSAQLDRRSCYPTSTNCCCFLNSLQDSIGEPTGLAIELAKSMVAAVAGNGSSTVGLFGGLFGFAAFVGLIEASGWIDAFGSGVVGGG